jgi:hypothetical protein
MPKVARTPWPGCVDELVQYGLLDIFNNLLFEPLRHVEIIQDLTGVLDLVLDDVEIAIETPASQIATKGVDDRCHLSVRYGHDEAQPNESRMSCGAALAGAPCAQASPQDRWRTT